VSGVVKAVAFDLIIEAAVDHSLKVSFIAIKHLVLYIVLPQDLV
jgi:hypothetical protein